MKDMIYEQAKNFKKKYPMTICWRLKAHCKVIEKHLNSDEEIKYVFAAQKNNNPLDIITTPGTFDASNPGDALSSSMNISEYAELMENTDAELPGIAEDYAAADFSGAPNADSDVSASESSVSEGETADTASDAGVSADEGGGADCGSDD